MHSFIFHMLQTRCGNVMYRSTMWLWCVQGTDRSQRPLEWKRDSRVEVQILVSDEPAVCTSSDCSQSSWKQQWNKRVIKHVCDMRTCRMLQLALTSSSRTDWFFSAVDRVVPAAKLHRLLKALLVHGLLDFLRLRKKRSGSVSARRRSAFFLFPNAEARSSICYSEGIQCSWRTFVCGNKAKTAVMCSSSQLGEKPATATLILSFFFNITWLVSMLLLPSRPEIHQIVIIIVLPLRWALNASALSRTFWLVMIQPFLAVSLLSSCFFKCPLCQKPDTEGGWLDLLYEGHCQSGILGGKNGDRLTVSKNPGSFACI